MTATVITDTLTFRNLKIGGGGWVTGHDQHSDGSLVCRTDVGGAWLWSNASSSWSQVINATSMPVGDVHQDLADGVYEIVFAPSNSSIVYMHFNGYVYRSADKCSTWTQKTAITGDRYDGANQGDQRHYASKMAVDPLDPDIVYVGTLDNGLWRTLNGGTSWTKLTGVPDATGTGGGEEPGVYCILFDPTSGSSSTPTRTSVVWAFSYGNGYYRSTDGGTTWSKPASGPSVLKHACFSTSGHLYAGTNDATGTAYKFSGGSWSTLATGFTQQAIPACDPNDANRVIFFGPGGFGIESTNGGSSWGSICWTQSRTATDVPWLAWTNEDYMSAGLIAFDKTVANRLLFSEGIGFWHTTLASGFTSMTWTSMTKGIEELVAQGVKQFSGSRRIYCVSMDRALFVIGNPDAYPHIHVNTSRTAPPSQAIDHGSDVSALRSNVSNMVMLSYYGGKRSYDGGHTWEAFPSGPTFGGYSAGQWPLASQICMVQANTWLAIAGGGLGFVRTTNGGSSWSNITLPDGSANNTLTFGLVHNRQNMAIDGVDANTVYVYGDNGVYRTTDAGANWTTRYTGNILSPTYFHAKIKSVPNQSQHLFASGGHASSGSPVSDYNSPTGNLYRSTDGGTSWVRCGAAGDILEVYDFDFGPVAPGSSYPVMWIVGWVNNSFGQYYCKDASVLDASTSGTWYKVGDYPLGILSARVAYVAADKVDYRRAFFGLQSQGFVYCSANAYSNSATLTLS